MTDDEKLYWQTAYEMFPNEKYIKQSSNPLREYEDEFIEGSIIDIGCGQSNFLLEYCNSFKNIYAVDSEYFQLDLLRKRAENLPGSDLRKWKFINANVPKEKLPEDLYSVIILSNFLHLSTLSRCKVMEESIRKFSTQGTLIYLLVYSTECCGNNPEDPSNNEYIKHYFTIDDLLDLFPKKKIRMGIQS